MPRGKPEPAPEDGSEASQPTNRSIWSGTISFGLVSIPVTLRPAVREGRISLRMLAEDGTPLARRYYCPKDNREVHPEHLLRGYEIEKDKYVVVTDEELESLEPEKTRDIDLRLFVDAAEVDPIYFERSYFLMPDKESNKAYRLLAETMERTKKLGIATFVMHDREHLVAIIAAKGILRAELMRFHDEVRSPDDVELPGDAKAKSADVSHFEKAIASLAEAHLSAKELRNRYTQKLQELVERKRKSGKDLVEAQAPDSPESGRKVTDLMAELRRSLEKNRAASKGASKRRPAADQEEEDTPTRASKAHPLKKMSKEELLAKAKALDIPGRSKMDREQLERAIRRKE